MATILVIDDNADLLQMMRVILQEKGRHKVVLSADGADGLSRAVSSPPDLAIVDVMMPGITGYDIVRRLREQPQTANLPILILTARGQMIDRQTALSAGADDHLAKPVTPKVLLDKVDELLASRKQTTKHETTSKIISLLSLRGGVGVTTLAVNVALSALQSPGEGSAPARVCLIDLSPASGQAALHLRVKAKKTWADLPNLVKDGSPSAWAGLLTSHASGLQVIAAPFEPTFANLLSASLIATALDELQARFDCIIIDTPPVLDVAAASALDNSGDVVLVLAPEIGAIQSTVATLQVMDEMQEKVKLVLNQTAPQAGVSEAVIERALKRPLSLRVPYDPAQVTALAQGKPLAWAKPSSPLAVAAQRLFGMMA
jgi:CheY-like chemotaxis protein/MinD-like ATPase involved in chromosome partitioning or flagellar assembly